MFSQKFYLLFFFSMGCVPACSNHYQDATTSQQDSGLVFDANFHDEARFDSEPHEWATLLFPTSVVSFTKGEGGGLNSDKLPAIVQGPPQGAGCCAGSSDTISLGNKGQITLKFDSPIIDGPGFDFIVFENAFWISNNPQTIFSELGEVSVSEDGSTWFTFSCDATKRMPPYKGCAGWAPVFINNTSTIDIAHLDRVGGDAFDLADLPNKPARVRFIRIRDLDSHRRAEEGLDGFDLDTIGAIHYEQP